MANEIRFGHQRTPFFSNPEKAPSVPFFIRVLLLTNPVNNVLYNTRNTTVYYFQDHLSWVKSTHPMRFGAETQSITHYNFSDSGTIPTVTLGLRAPGQCGNFPRNAINAPSFFQVDFSVLKRMRISERAHVEFRAEFFNPFNTINFGSGSLAFDAARFGQITSTFNARFGQMALRVNF